MPKNKIIIVLGAIVALLPVLGFPTSFESFLEVILGLGIIATSVWATIDKKLTQKAKAQRRQRERQVSQESELQTVESVEPESFTTETGEINNENGF